MRDGVSGVEGQVRAASGARLQMLAVYGAFTLIAAIVFGTLSYHPF